MLRRPIRMPSLTGRRRVIQPRASTAEQAPLSAWNNSGVGAWLELTGTQPSTVDPGTNPGGTGPAGKINAWNSLCIDTVTGHIYGAANGGHGDYAGNEVIRFRTRLASPAWDVLRAPTASGSIGGGASDHYTDGRPASVHSFYGQHFDGANNRLMRVGGSRYSDGFRSASCDGFDLATNDWLAAASIPNFPTGMSTEEEFVSCKDPRNSNVVCCGNNILARYNAATNNWTTINNGGAPAAYGGCSAFDTTRNRILIIGAQGAEYRFAPDSDSNLTSITLTGASASAIAGVGEMGMVYVTALDRYIVRKPDAGGTLYQVHPTTWEVTTFSTSGGGSIVRASSPETTPGIFNRLLYSPLDKGCILVPNNAGNVWFVRLH